MLNVDGGQNWWTTFADAAQTMKGRANAEEKECRTSYDDKASKVRKKLSVTWNSEKWPEVIVILFMAWTYTNMHKNTHTHTWALACTKAKSTIVYKRHTVLQIHQDTKFIRILWMRTNWITISLSNSLHFHLCNSWNYCKIQPREYTVEATIFQCIRMKSPNISQSIRAVRVTWVSQMEVLLLLPFLPCG